MFNTRILLLILIIFSNTFYPVAYSATSDGSGAIYIKPSYKLGVANKVPQATLDINGNILIKDGTQGAGKILKSDSNGLASWQTITGSGNGEWTDIGSALHSNGSPTSESIIIGANSLLSADLIFTNNGAVVINEQASAVNLRIEGDNNDTLLASNGRDNAIGIGLIEAIEKLNINGAIALDAFSSSPSATSGYGKVYVNGSILYYKNHLGNEFDLTAGDRGAAGTTSMVQFREDGQFQANGNFIWSDADLRLGLHNTVPDTVLDDNGAFTYRTFSVKPVYSSNGATIEGTASSINYMPGGGQGNLHIIILSLESSTLSSLPSGWIELTSSNIGSKISYILYRIQESGDPVSYNFNFNLSTNYTTQSIIINNPNKNVPFLSYQVFNGTITEASQTHTFPNITGVSPGSYLTLRIMTEEYGSPAWSRNTISTPGYITKTYGQANVHFNYIVGYNPSENTPISTATSSDNCSIPGMSICPDMDYLSFTLVLNNAELSVSDPDPKSSVLWLKSNGDTMVKTHNGGELKEFTLIDFQNNGAPITQDKEFNGLTLTSLDPNKLVKTDASKKLVSVNEITLNGFGLIGINNTNPQALLDLNGSMTFINGVDDMLVRDDLEVDGDIYASNLNISGSINANNILANTFQATEFVGGSFNGNFIGNGSNLTGVNPAAGETGFVQYNNGGKMGASENLFWDDAVARLGLHNTVPDTVLDDNGAFTYGAHCANLDFEFLSATESYNSPDPSQITINKPIGTQQGDLMIAVVSHDLMGSLATPPGWTLVAEDNYGIFHNSNVYYKVATSTEPLSYTFVLDNSMYFEIAAIVTYTGVDFTGVSFLSSTNTGELPAGAEDYTFNGLSSIPAGYKALRILTSSGSAGAVRENQIVAGYQYIYDTGDFTGLQEIHFQDKDAELNEASVLNTYLCTDPPATCSAETLRYVVYTLAFGISASGGSCIPQDPDPKSSVLWLKSNGDTMVKTHNGGELKEFTLIDFQGDPNEKFLNGLALTSLDPNKLVKTDASKKLVSVNEITLNGSGLIGIDNTNPQALLDLNGSMTFINGVDDMLIRDDIEVDGDIYASNLNISGSINANNILANTFQATEFVGGSFNGNFIGNGSNLVGVNLAAGEAGFVQYNNGGKMGASENLFWDDATVRLGLHNTAPDTVLDDNGAFTYRASDMIPPSGNGSEFVQVDREISNINNQTILPRLSNIQEDDLMIISIMAISDSEVSITPPPGWTLLENGSVLKGGSDSISHLNLTVTSALYYKVASGSEPVSYTFNNDGTYCTVDICYSGGIILAYRNVDASNPIVDHEKSIGTYSNSVNAFAPALSSLANNERVVRMITSSAYDEWQLFSDGGYTSRYGISAMYDEFTTGDKLLTGAIPLQYTNDPPCATCDPDEGFVSYSILLRNISSGSGNDDGFGSDDPDPKASLLWLKSNGDTMVKTHNGGELKEFTLIDFQNNGATITQDREFNGLTLTSLDPNKLVKTDANKKLVSVDEIIIDSGNAGFGLSSPNEKLTINGVLSFSEISAPSASSGFGKIYAKINGLFFKGASGTEYNINSGAAAGSSTELQFNNSGSFGANGNLTWNASHLASSRMLVDNANLASPSYSFITNSDSGIFNSAANNLDFSTGAAEYFSINGSKLSLSETYGFNTLTINGSTAFTSSAAINITAGAGITVTKALMLIQTSGGTIDIIANPQIADGTTDGQIVTLKGASDTNRVKLEDGTGLSLSDGVPVYLGLNDTITLMYDFNEDLWIELDRSFK